MNRIVSFDLESRTYDPAPDHTVSVACPEKWMNKNNRRRTHKVLGGEGGEASAAWPVSGGRRASCP